MIILRAGRADHLAEEWETVGKADLGVTQRMLVDVDGGTVKLLRIAIGGHFPLHQHPDRFEWLYVVDGEVETEVDGEVVLLGRGEFRVFPTHSYHRLSAPNGALALVGAFRHHSRSGHALA